MTSVVDTSVKHFHSAMAGAPVLNGVAGALAALLDASLINGFDVKAATSLVVASGVATLSFSGTHSATVDSVVLVTGSSIAALNGEQKVTAIGAGVVRFATAAADGAATGTISFKMAPAGWTSPFTGTNLRTYKSTDPASTGMILRLDDTGTTTARVVGYETMSDINTGTGPFPTAAQMSGGGHWNKSSAASATAVSWVLVADGRKFIIFVAGYSASNAAQLGGLTRGFGDDIALRPGGDPYACSLSYAVSTGYNVIEGCLDYVSAYQHAMPRSYTGLGACILHGLSPYTGSGNYLSGQDTFFGNFPSAVDGGLRLCRKFFCTTINSTPPRSDLPGLYHVPVGQTSGSFALRDIVPGTGALAGRKLLALRPTNSPSSGGNSDGLSLVDITGPWR
ncbi:hypothetical protein [Polaromonas naphthalenivorans]|uniref:Uncharacterized protein n=1 Tax=Polaromonas naphthalenivorans (strain CJ2) TaxID=365044 RepID=A1VPH5_POLNA|nr:hypothetical protein [Polaromonas naphthalenivorans]ABM37553.1 hypothetical protein Pnap_2245 [Polaromonas naphthalenivorans CJ2]